jgi:outer membrane protein OmpA-like peptidoglycan-associated protein/tetratricopeptide (TPR) repeat protein
MKRIALVFCFLFPCFFISFSQQDYKFRTKSKAAINLFKRGTHYYDQKQNEEAIIELEKAIKEDPNFLEARILLGDVYTDAKQFDKSVEHYKAALKIDPEYFPQNFMNLAKAEMQLNEFDSAKAHLDIFLTYKTRTMDIREKAEKLVKICNFASYAVKHPVPFNPVNLGDSINTEVDEYLPALTADDLTLFYTRRRVMGQDRFGRKDYNEDFLISKKEDGRWTSAIYLGAPINTTANEGAHCISPDGMFLYFTACNRDTYRGCDLFYSRKAGNKWSAPVNMGNAVNSDSWDSQPTISADGKTIYFLSSRPGGLGKQDIWKTTKNEKGTWSAPENLGPSINTPDNELSPFIHPDNHTLYFASDGHPGMGGTDIYYSRSGDDGKWQTPVNLGYPINTSGDESSLFVNAAGTSAYFASDRFNGKGGLDIYSFELYPEARPVPVSYVKGTVKDKNTKMGLEAEFEVIDIASGKTIANSFSDKTTGEFLVCLPSGKDYALNVSKEGYLFYSDHFSCKNPADRKNAYQLDIALSPAKAGEKVILKNIFYETNSYDLKPESFPELGKMVSFMKRNPNVTIEVSGYTDNVGDIKSNQALSEKRAKSVYDYLVKSGIEATKLTFKGYGESKPVATNDTEEGRSQNRRTEFAITAVK